MQLIVIRCPSCHNTYQVQPELRGKYTRCNNQACRKVFQVREAEAAAKGENGQPSAVKEPPDSHQDAGQHDAFSGTPKPSTITGSVADLLPVLGAEAADDASTEEEEPIFEVVPEESVGGIEDTELLPSGDVAAGASPESPPQQPAWMQPPPIRNPQTSGGRKETPAAPAAPRAPESPRRPSQPAPVPSWHRAPPPVRRQGTAPLESAALPSMPAVPPDHQGTPPNRVETELDAPTAPMPGTPVTPTTDWPPELGPESWTTTPGRQPPEQETASAHDHAAPATRKKRRRFLHFLLGLTLLSLVGVGIIGGLWYFEHGQNEDELYQQTKQEYEEGKFAKSAGSFKKLMEAYPDSARQDEYRFRAKLATARGLDVGNPPERNLGEFNQFVKENQDHPLFVDFHKDVGVTYGKLAESLIPLAKSFVAGKPPEIQRAIEVYQQAKNANEQAEKFFPHYAGGEAVISLLQEVRRDLARAEERQEFIAWLLAERPTPLREKEARRLIETKGLGSDAEIQQLLAQFRDRIFAAVTWTESETKLPTNAQGGTGAKDQGLTFVPLATKGTSPPTEKGVVFALARGVLYGLDKADGHMIWNTRVGIDTSALPVRLPRTETDPEIALVLSSETNTLTARQVANGEELWHHELSSPCLGRPVLVGRKAYVATFDGFIQEIEVISGRLLGWFNVGMRLSVGGAHQPGTDLVYFPADSLTVYAFDVGRHQCIGILQTDHPSGSLRGEPIVVSWDNLPPGSVARAASRSSYLILNQTDGLNAMRLRAFHLPLETRMAATPAVQQDVQVPGWSWFQPYCDGEKIALITDTGAVGLFGINQVSNQDQPLFPLVADGSRPVAIGGGRLPERALVVHAEENDFWVLVHGNLQRWRLGIDRTSGLQVSRGWQKQLADGSPLHAAQVSDNRDSLFLATQSVSRQDCLASAFETETGQVQWQRRLGLVSLGGPLVVGNKVLILDQGAGMVAFDPGAKFDGTGRNAGWPAAGQVLAAPLENVTAGPYWVADAGGKGVFEVVCHLPAKAGQRQYVLVVRHYDPDKGEATTQIFENLQANLGGTPAAGPDYLVLPLANGSLLRQALTNKTPDFDAWRTARADEAAQGHVISLGPNEFLVTDGSRGLTHIRWLADNQAMPVAKKELSDRIVSAPVLLPVGDNQSSAQVCVADSHGNLTLLRVADLQVVRNWSLEGEITAGPFRRGKHIGCVVDKTRLLWVDPASPKVLWEKDLDEDIVGQPNLGGDAVLVALVSGKVVGLDAASGQSLGPGYQLQAKVAPAAAPVAFGADLVFIPLTDGTVVLVPRDRFRKSS